jgi:hypothetical protein
MQSQQKMEGKKVDLLYTYILFRGEGTRVAELQHTQVPVNGATHAHAARVFSLSEPFTANRLL